MKETEQVVVVDETNVDLALGRRLDDGRILGVLLGIVRLDALQPPARCFLSQGDSHSRHEGLEGAVGGRPADTCPFHLGSVKSRMESGRSASLNLSVL